MSDDSQQPIVVGSAVQQAVITCQQAAEQALVVVSKAAARAGIAGQQVVQQTCLSGPASQQTTAEKASTQKASDQFAKASSAKTIGDASYQVIERANHRLQRLARNLGQPIDQFSQDTQWAT